MSDAWYYAIMIPTAFIFGWYSTAIWGWIKNKINRPGDQTP